MSNRRDRRGPQPVSGILEQVLESCGLSDRLKERSLLLEWSDVVGPEIAAHSRAVDIRDGELIIDADHGAWKQELSMLIPRIIEKFNEAYGAGAVKEVRWLNRPGNNRKSQDRK